VLTAQGYGVGRLYFRQQQEWSNSPGQLGRVSRQTVSVVEVGIYDPSLRVALALAGVLGMKVE
jgi:predicted transcriptional regulator